MARKRKNKVRIPVPGKRITVTSLYTEAVAHMVELEIQLLQMPNKPGLRGQLHRQYGMLNFTPKFDQVY